MYFYPPSNRTISFIYIFLFIFFHLLYINTPFVNLEWVYRQGSDYFITGDRFLLDQYFFRQANPLTYSYLVSFLVRLFELDQFAIYRLPALFGGTLLLLLLAKYRNPWLVLVVALNPLIWTYSGRAYSELLAVGLMFLAYEIQRQHTIRGVIAVFSGTVKYHTVPVLILHSSFHWLLSNWRNKFSSWNDQNLRANLILLAGFITFLIFYKELFGVWIAPEQYSEMLLKFSINNWINNFFGYGYYLSGMFFLTIPTFLNSKDIKQKILILSLSIILALSHENLGEMDFGSLEKLVGSEIILIIKALGFWNFLLCCKAFWKDEDSRILFLTILAYIMILSLTRPAQRYLIFVIPFWAMLIFQHISLSKIIQLGYLLVLIGLSSIMTLNQISTAYTAEEVAQWSLKYNIITDYGVIQPHVGGYKNYKVNSNYTVISGIPTDSRYLFTSKSIFGGPFHRQYTLIKKR